MSKKTIFNAIKFFMIVMLFLFAGVKVGWDIGIGRFDYTGKAHTITQSNNNNFNYTFSKNYIDNAYIEKNNIFDKYKIAGVTNNKYRIASVKSIAMALEEKGYTKKEVDSILTAMQKANGYKDTIDVVLVVLLHLLFASYVFFALRYKEK